MRTYRFAAVLLAACSVPDKLPVALDGGTDATPPIDAVGDLEAPETTILDAPLEFSSQGIAAFRFSSDDPTATFECSVDGDTPVACTSPFARSLTDGPHTFSVRAVDHAGNGDDTPAEHVWTIDTRAPETTLTEHPPAADNSVMVTFAFAATEDNVTFDCSVDGGPYAACTSGQSFGPFTDGAHGFAVRAHDRAGNVDSSPASHSWVIDTSTPDTQIITGPTGATGNTTATFTFLSPDAGPGATFLCRLDAAPAYVACTSPDNLVNLTEGAHTFSVRVRDAVGNIDPTPATRTWSVDLTPPDTTIINGPSGPEATASAGFAFTSTESNSTFECSLDAAAFASCTSPRSFTALAQGAHMFAVRATDQSGHQDLSPATRSWSVDTVAPDVTITSGPATGGTSGPRVAFGFTVSDGTITCSLETAPFMTCASPMAFSLPAGSHQFRVRATDTAGNVATVTRMWTVACAAPDAAGAEGLLHLDDSGQTLANAVTTGMPATLGDTAMVEPGDPALVASGRFAGGLAFTAAESDHVAWPAMSGPVVSPTVELWAKPDAAVGTRDVFVTGDGRVALRVATDGTATVHFAVSVIESGGAMATRTVNSASVASGTWHHVIASLDASVLRLWVDGTRTELAAVQVGVGPAFDALRLGGTGTAAYSGALDEVWFGKTAITTDDAALARYCPMP